VKLGQSFHVRQDQELNAVKTEESGERDSARALLIVEESQFLENNVGEQSPADVVPLDYSLVH
jgi:hypothetical protein